MCPLTYLKNHSFKCMLTLVMVGSPVMVLRYIIYLGFADDIMFSRNGSYGMSFVFLSGESMTAETTPSFPTTLCSMIKISNYSPRIVHWGVVCYLWLLCSSCKHFYNNSLMCKQFWSEVGVNCIQQKLYLFFTSSSTEDCQWQLEKWTV